MPARAIGNKLFQRIWCQTSMEMVTSPSIQTDTQPVSNISRAQTIWLMLSQAAALGLMALSLVWAAHYKHEQHKWSLPPASDQMLLIILMLCSLAVAIIPRWRRSAFAGILGSMALAFSCYLAREHTLPAIGKIDPLITDYIPQMSLTILLVALLIAIWGLVVRGGLADQARFGTAALYSALLISGLSLIYLMMFVFGVKMTNAVENWQLAELFALTLLYSLALWLGGLGLRPTTRWAILPAGTAGIFALFLIYWHAMPH